MRLLLPRAAACLSTTPPLRAPPLSCFATTPRRIAAVPLSHTAFSYSDSPDDEDSCPADTVSNYDSVGNGGARDSHNDYDDEDDGYDDYDKDDEKSDDSNSSSSRGGDLDNRDKYKYPNFDQEKSRTSPFLLFLQFALRSYSRKQRSVIDGSMAGDYGFDILGIANTKARLKRLREIELKHARLAMLAAVGWPLSELYSEPLQRLSDYGNNSLYQPSLTPEGLAPTIWNGGLLTGPNAVAFGLYLLLVSVLDYIGFSRRNSKKTASFDPGDFNFDPFNLYESKGRSPFGRKRLRTLEVDNGRIAMVAVLIYFISEYSSHMSIVQRTPFFFTPIQGPQSFLI